MFSSRSKVTLRDDNGSRAGVRSNSPVSCLKRSATDAESAGRVTSSELSPLFYSQGHLEASQ